MSKADEARFDRLHLLYQIAASRDTGGFASYNQWGWRNDAYALVEKHRQRHEALKRDPCALRFFSTEEHDAGPSGTANVVVSDFGTRLKTSAYTERGQPRWKITEMRSYAGLDTTSGAGGSYWTPIEFWGAVLMQLKRIDELFAAAKWLTTSDGNILDYPL